MIYRLNIFQEKDLVRELKKINCDPHGVKIMQGKLSGITLKITDIPGYLALIIKETALSCGAEFALPKLAIRKTEAIYDGLLLATRVQIKKIILSLKKQPFKILKEVRADLSQIIQPQKIKLPEIMGILNVTPDSFSDGGKYLRTEAAVNQALKMYQAGAKIIDIGGESTRPGAAEISLKEELSRTIPVIEQIHKHNKKIVISIDTTKSAVAEKAIKAGAVILNDISGLTRDPKIADLAARYQTKLILMHRLAPSKTMQTNPVYSDLLKEILNFLRKSSEYALSRGVKKENIIIDPGIGFGKTTEHNLYLIKQLCAFKSLGYAVLIGTSRKSVIGNILKKSPEQRLSGTIATVLASQLQNVDYIRVHDVSESLDAVKVFHKILTI